MLLFEKSEDVRLLPERLFDLSVGQFKKLPVFQLPAVQTPQPLDRPPFGGRRAQDPIDGAKGRKSVLESHGAHVLHKAQGERLSQFLRRLQNQSFPKDRKSTRLNSSHSS